MHPSSYLENRFVEITEQFREMFYKSIKSYSDLHSSTISEADSFGKTLKTPLESDMTRQNPLESFRNRSELLSIKGEWNNYSVNFKNPFRTENIRIYPEGLFYLKFS